MSEIGKKVFRTTRGAPIEGVRSTEPTTDADGSGLSERDEPEEVTDDADLTPRAKRRMERIREYAWCCGSGGGAKSAYPDFALSTAKERIEEASCTGAGTIVTACPWCEANLNDGIDATESKLKVEDILDLVIESMGE